MVALAGLSRSVFMACDISTIISPRTVITLAENAEIICDINLGFNLSFLNKCDEIERETVREYYQRCFDKDLKDSQQASEAN